MCLLVRYVCPNSRKVCIKFLEFILLDAKNCTVEALHNYIHKSITDKGLSMKLIIGFGTNNASGRVKQLFTDAIKTRKS